MVIWGLRTLLNQWLEDRGHVENHQSMDEDEDTPDSSRVYCKYRSSHRKYIKNIHAQINSHFVLIVSL